jgi:hypothetical protein
MICWTLFRTAALSFAFFSVAALTPAAVETASAQSSVLGHAVIPGTGKTYYVSPYGNDANNGLSTATSWRTISHAVDASSNSGVAPGDTVLVLPGTYVEQVWFSRSGSAQEYIKLKSSTSRAALIRPPANAYSTVSVMASHVAILGFDVQGGAGHAIDGSISSGGRALRNHHIVIANNYVHDSGGGGIEMAWGDYYTIEWNLAEKNCARNPYHTSGISLYQLNASDTATGVHSVVRYNISRHNSETSAITSQHTDGNGIIIDDANNTQASTGRSGAYVHETLVEGNLVYGNGGKGLQVTWSNYVVARDNTFYKNNRDNANPGTWRGELSYNFSSHGTFANNIMVADTSVNRYNTAIGDQTVSAQWPTSGGQWIDNLTFNGTAGATSIAIDSTTSKIVGTVSGKDPKFVAPSLDPAVANFHLQSGSPAAGVGYALSASQVDLLGRLRGTPASLGAYLP